MLEVWFASLGPLTSALLEAAVGEAISRTPAPPPLPKKEEPKIIEGYELVKPLGEGGIGSVWLVRKPGAERFFVRLMLRADDFGRYHANPAMLANMLFPLRRDIEPDMVTDWINQCQQAKLLRVYQVDGRQCLEIAKFGGKPRAQHSKFPQPPDVCEQMHADASNCEQMRPYSYAYSDTSASASAVTLPTLEEVIEEGRKRQIPADVCTKFFNACEERPLTPEGGWTLRSGQPMNMTKWSASLANYASSFQNNQRKGHAHANNGKSGADRIRSYSGVNKPERY
jgi:hypothetical protein